MGAPSFYFHLKRRSFLLLGLLALLPMGALAKDNERLNVLLICIDDLRPELKCFGEGK